jgi:hypothetical protein
LSGPEEDDPHALVTNGTTASNPNAKQARKTIEQFSLRGHRAFEPGERALVLSPHLRADQALRGSTFEPVRPISTRRAVDGR